MPLTSACSVVEKRFAQALRHRPYARMQIGFHSSLSSPTNSFSRSDVGSPGYCAPELLTRQLEHERLPVKKSTSASEIALLAESLRSGKWVA